MKLNFIVSLLFVSISLAAKNSDAYLSIKVLNKKGKSGVLYTFGNRTLDLYEVRLSYKLAVNNATRSDLQSFMVVCRLEKNSKNIRLADYLVSTDKSLHLFFKKLPAGTRLDFGIIWNSINSNNIKIWPKRAVLTIQSDKLNQEKIWSKKINQSRVKIASKAVELAIDPQADTRCELLLHN